MIATPLEHIRASYYTVNALVSVQVFSNQFAFVRGTSGNNNINQSRAMPHAFMVSHLAVFFNRLFCFDFLMIAMTLLPPPTFLLY